MPRETTPRVRSRLKIRFISKCSQQAGKPNSVSLDSALSRLARDDDHSSRPVIADRLQQPTRKRRTGRPVRLSPGASLFGLAPCGVLPATRVTTGAVRSYRTFSPLPRVPMNTRIVSSTTGDEAVYFLCHFPSGCPDRVLPGTLPCGVRTFLSPLSRQACASRYGGQRSSGLLR